MKSILIFLSLIIPITSFSQIYNLDSFELEKALTKKFNQINADLFKHYKSGKIIGFMNDSIATRKIVVADTPSCYDLKKPKGLMASYFKTNDVENGGINFKLQSLGLIYPVYFEGIKLMPQSYCYIPMSEIEKVFSYRNILLTKSTAGLLFNTFNPIEFADKQDKNCENYVLENQLYTIQDNSYSDVYNVKIDSAYLNKINSLIRLQTSNAINEILISGKFGFFKDSALKTSFSINESIDIAYCKVSIDTPSPTREYSYNCIYERLNQIIFTKNALGFRLGNSTFYVPFDYIKGQPVWFRLFCTVWDRDERKY